MNKSSAIVLCAGKGLRMRSGRSKVLHKIAGLEIVNHVLRTLEAASVDRIILVVSRDNERDIRNIVPANVEMVVQREIDGTASASRIGAEALGDYDGTVLVTYCDVPLVRGETYGKMLEALERTDDSLIVLGFHTKDTANAYGRLILGSSGKLEKIVEYRDATGLERGNSLCNAGIYALRSPELLKHLIRSVRNDNAAREYYLTDTIEIALEQKYGCSYVLAEEEEVMGVNSRVELARVERVFQDVRRKEFMTAGVTLVDPGSVFFSHDTEIENDVIVEPSVMFMNGVKVHSGVQIKSFSYLEGCEIESGSTIGPFARIRPKSILGKNSRVGNFCEIKESVVGDGVKISHLSYIGDAEVGENTNIGAGTITCNYDGYSKFRTNIGKNSLIGSNTIMVAPVEIGENSLTAAGSIITRSAEKNSLIVARPEQKILSEGMTRYRAKREKPPKT
ncbi:MAG: bifunctional UDP-N-acetylglucosamine diphosphorylase/glucosamine-1-phosphate N-acetyltransferase GlmU [Rickettsiales bacterium]|jgi:bifunctional UDP-N-acetylglucosamine pyrophosphorylase/glucosamine-1-phosphate N-acetyltransferase|nr:bifunctional UDP-N-acetylglucosamine diphosphorylase/glucosamine-1-phosphate N-acetyltransferase GlmU [Rickettsiales bacterium]